VVHEYMREKISSPYRIFRLRLRLLLHYTEMSQIRWLCPHVQEVFKLV